MLSLRFKNEYKGLFKKEKPKNVIINNNKQISKMWTNKSMNSFINIPKQPMLVVLAVWFIPVWILEKMKT